MRRKDWECIRDCLNQRLEGCVDETASGAEARALSAQIQETLKRVHCAMSGRSLSGIKKLETKFRAASAGGDNTGLCQGGID